LGTPIFDFGWYDPGREVRAKPSFEGACLIPKKPPLGWHSEITPGGIIRLVKQGIVTGERKAIDKGKVVAAAIGGGSA